MADATSNGQEAQRSDGDVHAPRTLAQKLDHLFTTMRPAGRGEYSYQEVATALEERGGPTISATYVWQLRKGVRDNPTKKHMEALADFFGVPPAYFFDDEGAERVDAELRMLATIRAQAVRDLLPWLDGLQDASVQAVRGVVERLREVEGLPDPSEDSGREQDGAGVSDDAGGGPGRRRTKRRPGSEKS